MAASMITSTLTKYCRLTADVPIAPFPKATHLPCDRYLHAVLQSLPGLLRHRGYRKRTAGRARLVFPEGFQLAVAMYALIQPATKSSPVYLHAVKNEPLRIESALICQDTGERWLAVLLAFFVYDDQLWLSLLKATISRNCTAE